MLYFKQIEIGPMRNYVYLIGSTETRKVAVVDAAWEIDTILKIAAQDDVEVTHAFVTHTHPDHVGGHFSGIEIPGVNELLSKCKLKVVVHKAEADALKGLVPSDIIKAESGDKIDVGGVEIQLLHTPGHTPGSQCFLRRGAGNLGRYDVYRCLRASGFPRRQRRANVLQLTQKLMALPDDTILFPGHNYARLPHATIGEQKKANPYLKFSSLKQFLAAMGYG